MVSGLDPHSSYLSSEDFDELKIGTTGKFGGLGIEITTEDSFVKVKTKGGELSVIFEEVC